MSLMNLLAPTYIQMLEALSRWLKKAETQLPMGEAEALLLSSLTPDMFPLATQVRFACVQAREGIHRLRREDFPPARRREERADTAWHSGRRATPYQGDCRMGEAIGFG